METVELKGAEPTEALPKQDNREFEIKSTAKAETISIIILNEQNVHDLSPKHNVYFGKKPHTNKVVRVPKPNHIRVQNTEPLWVRVASVQMTAGGLLGLQLISRRHRSVHLEQMATLYHIEVPHLSKLHPLQALPPNFFWSWQPYFG